MKVATNNLFIIILIIFVVFILFLRSPVYKYILGESRSNLLEGMTSSKTHESEFILAKDRGMWSGEGPNEYTCKNDPKRNTKGNNGDYDRYCIFDKEIDAQNHCKSEDRCVGYISNQARNMFTATAKPVPNPGANGRHYEKRKIPASEPRLSFQKLDNTNCVYGRIKYPGESSIVNGYTYLGDFDSYDQCAQSNNIPREAKAITYHDTSISGYARQCYSINDNNKKVLNQKYATCGLVTPAAPAPAIATSLGPTIPNPGSTIPNPAPSPSPVGGRCNQQLCRKVKDPRFAGGACNLDKSIGKIVCSACPEVNGEVNCNNFRATCSGCGSDLRATFPAGWQPDRDRRPGPKEKPFTRTECETSCENPGVKIFQNYLDTFRDGAGFDDGSCQIIGKNKDMVKCRPIRKTAGLGVRVNGGMKPIPAPDECVLCDEPKLQGYATFERKWDKYAKQNDYVNVKLVDGPRSGASYGPNEEGRGMRGSGAQNWERWDGGDSTNGAGWRGQQTGGWYQTMTDVKNKSFQVATSNNDGNRQQAYIESLKLKLNKLNDEYITQQILVNKMKEDISKMVSACGLAKSKLGEAMKSSVSDSMNKNAAITLKEKIDANTNAGNIEMLQQNVKKSCDKSMEVSNSYNSAIKQLSIIDAKRQELSEKLAIAINSVTENKTTININLMGGMGGMGGMGDCGGRLGCGTGVNNNNMYPGNFFKPQRINDMINNVNIPMPYQDIIIF
jgi:hypothetical protein